MFSDIEDLQNTCFLLIIYYLFINDQYRKVQFPISMKKQN